MKKKVIALTLGCLLGVSCNVFAASPFEDVPPDHWAYNSVAKLAKAGLVDGYHDGTFRGSKTITRYEMATIIANAMTKDNKADESTKAEVEKLKVEFSSELESLGIRMSKVEKRMDKAEKTQIKIAARQIYAHANNVSSDNNPVDQYYHYRLFMTTNLDPNAQFISMVENTDDITSNSYTTGQGSNFTAKQAYLRAKVGQTVLNVGRQPFSWLGNGLVCDNSGKWDGITAEFGIGSKFTIRTGAAQRYMGATTGGSLTAPGGTHSFYMANAKYNVSPSFNLISVYLKDQGVRNNQNSSIYDTTSIGFNYTFDKYSLMSEYGANEADLAKAANKNSTPKAGYVQLQYKKVDQDKVGTWDVFTNYRKAQAGFDLGNMTTLDNFKNWGIASAANDIKGFGLVYEYVPFKKTVLSLRGFRLKDNATNSKSYNAYAIRMDYNY